jgi:hypothetical protein
MEASIEHYGVLLAIGGAVLLLAFFVGGISARYSVAERYAWGLKFNRMFHAIVALVGLYVVLSEPHTVWSAIVGCFMIWIGLWLDTLPPPPRPKSIFEVMCENAYKRDPHSLLGRAVAEELGDSSEEKV